MELNNKICIIGGGPAGMMAAGTAICYGADVTIFESMPFLGKKLGIEADKRKIQLKETIKAYGKYDVEIKILADISAKFIVHVHQ